MFKGFNIAQKKKKGIYNIRCGRREENKRDPNYMISQRSSKAQHTLPHATEADNAKLEIPIKYM